MRKLFVESSDFTEWVNRCLDDDVYAALQHSLSENPNLGAVIPGCGGLRKLRLADSRRGRGKRGGTRVVYLHVPEVNWFFMLDVYSKGEKEDISMGEKKILRRLATQFRAEALVNRKQKGR